MHVALSAVGVDRPGIVAAVTKVLHAQGANIEDSRMAILGGHFAMILIVALPEDADIGALERALDEPARALDLVVSLRPVAEAAEHHALGDPYILSVYGADHPGIVASVSSLLAERLVNIDDLTTHVIEADTPVYVMILEVTVPPDTDAAALEAKLKQLGTELAVDVSMRPADADNF